MSDFPRGWTQSSFSGAGLVSITIPALAGVVHVLDSFQATIASPTAAAGVLVQLSSSDGTFTAFDLGFIQADAGPSNGTASGSGLDLAAGPGASLTIAFGSFPAGCDEFLLVQGHDI